MAEDPQTDRLLRAALGRRAGHACAEAAVGECLDAETLAAWSADTLSTAEVDDVEAHLATCARCQEMAAIFARGDVAPARVVPFRPRPWSIRWIGPIAAAAAAVTVWFVMRPVDRATPALDTIARVEPTTQPAPAAAQEIAAGRERALSEPKREAPKNDRQDAAASNKLMKDARTAGARTSEEQLADKKAAETRDAQARLAAPARAEPPPAPAPRPAATPAPPPPPPAPVAAPTTATAAPPPVGAVSDAMRQQASGVRPPGTFRAAVEIDSRAVVAEFTSSVAFAEAPAAGGGGGAGRGGGGGRGAGRGGAAPPAASAANLAPGLPLPRWRILASGVAERSADSGATWTAVAIDPPAQITAGVSPSPVTCWLAGRGGVVLLSTDGRRFERVSSPVQMDLSSIRATDARQASVTTADGRVFVTNDGGATWRLQGFSPSPF